jgi:hypothetical protein
VLLIVAAVVAIIVVALIASSGGSVTPPATAAATVVPSDVLAYVHFSTDETRSEVPTTLALLRGLPNYSSLLNTLETRLDLANLFAGVNFDHQVLPWLGKDAAVAVLPTSGSSSSDLVVIAVSSPAAATHFLAGRPSDGKASYDGITITGHPGAGDTALVGHYLLIGHSGSIRAAIDAARGRAPALSADPVFKRATESEPAGRTVDAYIPALGVTRLLTPQVGLAGLPGALLYEPSLQGVAVALTPASGGLQLYVHSVFDPRLARTPAPSFTPTLESSVPSGAAFFLDTSSLGGLLPRVLSTLGVGARIPELLKKLGAALSAQGIDVKHDIDALFAHESAVVITDHNGAPVVTVITRTPNPTQTQTVFAELENPLARLFAPAGNAAGQAPLFNTVAVGGVTAHQLVLTPGLQFDYAVSGGKLVMSTSIAGIAAIARQAGSIEGEQTYQQALGNRPSRVTSLLFLDAGQLLSLGKRYGLITGAALAALRPDLDQVRTIGMYSTSGEGQSTAQLFVQIP